MIQFVKFIKNRTKDNHSFLTTCLFSKIPYKTLTGERIRIIHFDLPFCEMFNARYFIKSYFCIKT
jgi:hypothetical protein